MSDPPSEYRDLPGTPAGPTSERTVDALYEQVRGLVPAVSTAGPPPNATPVAPGIRVLALQTPTLPPAAHTNVYLVGPDAGPVAVVDPGSPYPEQQAALDRVLERSPPSAVLLTHHHGDHVGGAQALADRWGVPIVAHATTAARLAGWIRVTQTISDGDVAYGVQAILTPGHAEGHLCFAVGDATIAGDMVAGLGTILIDPSDGDMAVYLASLERLLARPQATLLPAHGPVIPDGHAKLREYISHRLAREAKVAAALQATPRTLGELVSEAYCDTPRMLWGLAERSMLAHLIKLAREHRAIDVGGGRWSR
ncbi:MAG TPA: MBL fold metallo-hydrolase [Kofleriaceae bacterium]|jgi:glyoxylase-like metal-dependent hydrolase (beta-lactamase superfamily II)|nr:MBL fold metallo-hydrolase [Kofleriaceae bacterium]